MPTPSKSGIRPDAETLEGAAENNGPPGLPTSRTAAAAFELILSHQLLLWSGDVEGALGIHAENAPRTLDGYLSLLREDTRAEARRGFEDALSREAAFEALHTFDRGPRPRRIHVLGIIQRDEEGEAIRLHCTLHDVSAPEAELSRQWNSRAAAGLEHSRRRFRALAEAMHNGFCEIDPSGAITYANARFLEMIGCAEEAVRGGHLPDLFDGATGARLARLFSPGSTGAVCVEAALIRSSREPALARISITPVHDVEGVISGHLAIVSDITEHRAAQSELRRVKNEMERLLESSSTVIYNCKRSQPFAFTSIGSNAGRVLGMPPAALMEDPSVFVRRIEPEDRERMLAGVLAWNGRSGLSMIYRLRRADGSVRWIQDSRRVVKEDVSGEELIVGCLQDVTSLRLAQDSLKEQEALFRAVVQNTHDIVTLMELDGTVLYLSPSFKTVLERDPAEAIGRNIVYCIVAEDWPLLKSTIVELAETPDATATVELRAPHADGSLRMFETIVKILPKESGLKAVLTTCRDVTERKKAEDQRGLLEARLAHQAYHDSLTGLPNRKLFMERLAGALRRGREESASFAALYIDIDHFKQINDKLGHVEADHVLQSFVARVLSALREGDMLARLGGDEFGIVVDGFESPRDVVGLASRIEERVTGPIHAPGGGEVVCTASIGIVFGDPEIESIPEIIKRADTAMYYAKSNGRARHEVFAPRMLEERESVLELRNGLLGALERQEMIVEYQPVVSLRTGEITRCEALLRWRFGDAGIVPPDRFIQIAEEYGLIDQLAVWCLETVCGQLRLWRGEGVEIPCVAVNLSGQNLRSASFVERLPEILSSHGVRPDQIEIEIPESAMFAPIEEDGGGLLEGVRRIGVGIAVDDFGKGCSSFSHLRGLPAQAVKIDRSVVADLAGDERAAAIVRAIVGLAAAFGFRVTGEGVETDEQLAILRREGCDEAQGFLFCRPCSPEQVARFLKEWSAPWTPVRSLE